MSMSTVTRTVAGLLLAGLLSGAAAGCGSDRDSGSTAADFASLFKGYGADYTHVDTPAALADESALVVEGRIGKIEKGRTIGAAVDEPGASPTVVVAVTVTRTHRGALPAQAEGKVYVELSAPRGLNIGRYERAAPKHSTVLFYLAPAPPAIDFPVVDPDAGRPAGQPLYQPVSPQGFLIEDNRKVLQILMFTEFEGASLGDFTPDSPRFPHGRHKHGH
ncbi:hypothetical protein [Allorhizocola rhizosphaerae]|uniref:hypothetical protein n=1 Tax=Allorhizocola rhizosphaerae TaxID=1872709 RepID=UPI0013C2EEF3|nr:hypothetical protein [Allorhizocola rhizosphaerae]